MNVYVLYFEQLTYCTYIENIYISFLCNMHAYSGMFSRCPMVSDGFFLKLYTEGALINLVFV